MEAKDRYIPKSVAIIMDGNGRWAKKRGLPRTFGHKEGVKTVEKIVEIAGNIGIKYLTVYAFSTENWKRSKEEVDALMNLFRLYAPRLLERARANDVLIKVIGDKRFFPEDVIKSIDTLERETASNKGLNFIIAANYGGRDEIRRAAYKFALDFRDGKVAPEALTAHKDKAINGELSEEGFAMYLDTYGVPDPELVIRTSGEMRISNFLLWEMAYAEIVISDKLWPDFDKEELLRCIDEFNHRSRRFGGV